MKFSGASAISKQLTWAMYVLYAYPYSVSITTSAQPVALYLAGLNLMLPQQTIGKERLLNVSGFITRAYLLSLS
ncbi:general transcription and DNA repair factor IIH subunit TFB4 [Trifolium repens]|nr:general transcription and DNA repair factor IIH subunit TFB4 [Trifolium repens]